MRAIPFAYWGRRRVVIDPPGEPGQQPGLHAEALLIEEYIVERVSRNRVQIHAETLDASEHTLFHKIIRIVEGSGLVEAYVLHRVSRNRVRSIFEEIYAAESGLIHKEIHTSAPAHLVEAFERYIESRLRTKIHAEVLSASEALHDTRQVVFPALVRTADLIDGFERTVGSRIRRVEHGEVLTASEVVAHYRRIQIAVAEGASLAEGYSRERVSRNRQRVHAEALSAAEQIQRARRFGSADAAALLEAYQRTIESRNRLKIYAETLSASEGISIDMAYVQPPDAPTIFSASATSSTVTIDYRTGNWTQSIQIMRSVNGAAFTEFSTTLVNQATNYTLNLPTGPLGASSGDNVQIRLVPYSRPNKGGAQGPYAETSVVIP